MGEWRTIDSAPKDGRDYWVKAEADDLPAMECWCGWHPDAGWCADELREVTHWKTPPPAEAKQLESEER